MKKTTILFLLFIGLQLVAQDKLTSISEEYFTDNQWELLNKTAYLYDANGNVMSEKYYSTNGTANVELLETTNYIYNANNKLIEERYEDSKNVYSYNANGVITEVISYTLENGVWVKENKFELVFNGTQIDYFTSFVWNGQAWVVPEEESERYTYTYANGNIVKIIDEEFKNGVWEERGKEEFTYDANNNLTSEFFYFKEDNGSYTVNEFYNYSYDSNNNIISRSGAYIDSNGMQVNFETENYTYDLSKSMSTIINPFKNKFGIELFPDTDKHHINKIISKTSPSYRVIYNYNEATASVDKFDNVQFSVYPNPTTSILKIDDSNFALKNVSLFNVLGKKVLSSSKNEINLENLSKGIYLVKILNQNNKFATKRIVKN